jgi:hypothetical protein
MRSSSREISTWWLEDKLRWVAVRVSMGVMMQLTTQYLTFVYATQTSESASSDVTVCLVSVSAFA